MKSLRTIFVLLAVLLVALPIGGWLFARQSASFDAAKSFVRTDRQIQSKIGPVLEVSLPFFGYSIKRTGGSGEASYTLNLAGERGTAIVNTQLAYRGSWSVASATLAAPSGPIRLQVAD